MVQELAVNGEKPRRRPGRPTRAEATARALAEIGVDPVTIDPRRILAAIAADESAPASARVSACKVLLQGTSKDTEEETVATVGAVADRAIRLLAATRRGH